MASFFRFLGQLLRRLLGTPQPVPPDQTPVQPPPTNPTPSNPTPDPSTGGSDTPGISPVPPAIPPSPPAIPDDLAGIDVPGLPPILASRRWTLMIFMAGDNGLKFETEAGWEQVMAEMTSAGYKDIVELRTAGTSDQVACVVQFDTVSEADRSYRIIINPPGQAPTVQTIPETNTGDPVTLSDFITWGQQTFPAEHYAVVIWNHGGGWKEDDLWARYRDALPVGTRNAGGRSVLSAQKMRKSLFFSTTDRIMALPDDAPPPVFPSTRESAAPFPASIEDAPLDLEIPGSDSPFLDRLAREGSQAGTDLPSTRWIAADDSSKDFLDNAELQSAFQQAAVQTGETVDIIGMDACLMAMVEVAFQLRNNATFLVASQEVEPMAGWDYTNLLRALVVQPTLRPEQVAEAMVDLYMASYQDGGQSVTQSATILGQMDALGELINRFVEAVERHWDSQPGLTTGLRRAQLNALTFDDPDYRDLVDFLRLVVWEMESLPSAAPAESSSTDGETGRDAIGRAAEEILQVIGDPMRSPLLTNGVAGVKYQQPGTGTYRAHGLTIYLPDQHISQFYDTLDFRISRWGDLVRLLNGIEA